MVLSSIDKRNRLFLWLSLALTAMAFANVLSTAGRGRFTIGWTIGRLSWPISACVLFVYLMVVYARDQLLLTHVRELLRDGAADQANGLHHVGTAQVPIALAGFVASENVVRYRRMLEEPQDEATRSVLLRLLAEEQRRQEQLSKAEP
jgi:hypothetical protein